MGEPRIPCWLRGPVAGIAAPLQPVAHALLETREEVESAIAPLAPDQLAARPGGAASIAFHVLHIAGATDRLFTYARGEALDEAQREALAREKNPPPSDASSLVAALDASLRACLGQLQEVDVGTLPEAREVGRARLPSTVLGLLVHAAEHAQRHSGQIVTTARIVASAGDPPG